MKSDSPDKHLGGSLSADGISPLFFSPEQGDQKSQSAKAKKASAGDGKGSLTRIFKMVKETKLFTSRLST